MTEFEMFEILIPLVCLIGIGWLVYFVFSASLLFKKEDNKKNDSKSSIALKWLMAIAGIIIGLFSLLLALFITFLIRADENVSLGFYLINLGVYITSLFLLYKSIKWIRNF